MHIIFGRRTGIRTDLAGVAVWSTTAQYRLHQTRWGLFCLGFRCLHVSNCSLPYLVILLISRLLPSPLSRRLCLRSVPTESGAETMEIKKNQESVGTYPFLYRYIKCPQCVHCSHKAHSNRILSPFLLNSTMPQSPPVEV
jgi:hypothetical protein